jgi:hypothetical protein
MEKYSFGLQFYALWADFEEQIKLMNQRITVLLRWLI